MKNNKQLKLRKIISRALDKRLESIKVEKLQKERIYSTRKEYYKVQVGVNKIYHVTTGEGLEDVYKKSIQFNKEFPFISCKPVDYINEEGGELFIQEYYQGNSLDELLSSGEISDAELNDLLADLASILRSAEVPSCEMAAKKEFWGFSEELLACRSLSKFDRIFFKESLLPELEHLLISDTLCKRWSNGDLIGQNIMLSGDGDIRIIDCEFAKLTHFHYEDWIRLKMFSNSKISESSAYISELRDIPPVFEAYFWLNQVILSDGVFSSSKANEYIPRYLERFYEIFKSYSGAFKSASLIVGGLAEKNEALSHVLSQTHAEHAANQSQQAVYEKDIQEKNRLIDELKQRVEQSEDIQNISEKLRGLLHEGKTKYIEIESYITELEANRIQEKNLEENLKNTQELYEKTKAELLTSNNEIKLLSDRIRGQKGAIEGISRSKEEVVRKLLSTNGVNGNLERVRRDLEKQLKTWMIKYNDLKKRNDQVDDEKNEINNYLTLVERRAKEAEVEFNNLEIRLKEHKSLIQTLKNTNDVLSSRVSELENLSHRYLKEIQALKAATQVFRDKIYRMTCSVSWKITAPLRFLRRHFVDLEKLGTSDTEIEIAEDTSIGPVESETHNKDLPADSYQQWIQFVEPTTLSNPRIFTHNPKVSILMPVYKPDLHFLKAAIESVLSQSYSNWELCLADDHSQDNELEEMIQQFAKADNRIRYTFLKHNGHISKTTNEALQLSTGDYVAFMDHDDLLREFSLAEMVAAINEHPTGKFFYSDEDKIDDQERRHTPHFKPDWNPQLILSQNYICHFMMIQASLVREVGGLRVGVEGSQDWDLVLRATEKLTREEIIHIPKILYHWRESAQSTALNPDSKNYAMLAGETALKDHFKRTKIDAAPESYAWGCFIPRFKINEDPSLTLIIPTKNGGEVLQKCLSSIYRFVSESQFEVVVIDNGSDDPLTLHTLEEFQSHHCNFSVFRDTSPFNFSKLNNKAVDQIESELVLFLNDDTEMLTEDWLEQIKANAIRPEIGAVGAKLLYPDDTIQHAGVVLGVLGVAGHAFRTQPRYTTSQFHRANLPHNVSAVTGAFLCIRRKVFKEVGGFDEDQLAVAFNDIDLCIKIRERGYYNLYLPTVEVRHYESYSRGTEDTPEKRDRFSGEIKTMLDRWGHFLHCDPFYNPNFSLENDQYEIRTV